MDKKKLILAQLCAEAIDYMSRTIDDWEDMIQDAMWLMSGGIGDAEDLAEEFDRVFQETFGITFSDAKKLNQF